MLDLLDEMTAKRIKLEEPALRALVNWGIAAGDLSLLQSALVAARAAAKSRARSEDAKWCVVMRARVEDAGSYATETRGGAQVWIDGSMASWRIARRVVEHAFSMDPARFEAFGVEPIRRDSMDEGNPEHVVYFQAPRRARGGYVASFVAHFVSDSTRADLETAAARRVFVAALFAELFGVRGGGTASLVGTVPHTSGQRCHLERRPLRHCD